MVGRLVSFCIFRIYIYIIINIYIYIKPTPFLFGLHVFFEGGVKLTFLRFLTDYKFNKLNPIYKTWFQPTNFHLGKLTLLAPAPTCRICLSFHLFRMGGAGWFPSWDPWILGIHGILCFRCNMLDKGSSKNTNPNNALLRGNPSKSTIDLGFSLLDPIKMVPI